MGGTVTLSIVIALKDGKANLPALMGAVAGRDEQTEIIICCAGAPPSFETRENVTTYALPPDTLIPSLWSEGIMRSRGNRVALTSTEFVPSPSWLARLAAADMHQWVGVGGAIENDVAASPTSWAIFFLRYSAFSPPLKAGETDEIAADNAVYDRAAILEYSDLLQEGFWEPSFHRRFRAVGRKLMLDPELVVIHHGTVSAPSFTRQRYLHGREYGIERAQRGSVGRNLLLLASSPLVQPLLLARIASRIAKRPRYRSKLVVAFPWLVRFTFAWAAGEAAGYLSALGSRRRAGAVIPSKGSA